VVVAVALALVLAVCGCGMPRVPVEKTSARYDFEAGRVALEAKRYLDAQTFLKRFLDLNPGHAVADSAQLLLGLAQAGSGSFAEAAVEFAILVREFPRSELRDDAGYQECLAYSSQMRPAQLDATFALRARGCFNEFLLRFPESSLGEEARARLVEISDRLAEKEYRTASMFFSLKHHESSLVYIDELLEKYGNSTWVPQALLLRARCFVQLERFGDAMQSLQGLLASFPEHRVADDARRLLEQLRARDDAPQAPDSGTGTEER
jgi:outer membrane protein assembly factor BamD